MSQSFIKLLEDAGLSKSSIKLYNIKLRQLDNKFNISNKDIFLESNLQYLDILKFIDSQKN